MRDRTLIKSKWAYYAIVLLFDSLVGAFCVAAAVRWRYDFLNVPVPPTIDEVAGGVAFGLCILVWSALKVPRAIWRYTSLDDVLNIARAVVIVMLLLPLFMYLFVNAGTGFPRSAPFIAGPAFLGALVVSRLCILMLRNGDVRGILNKQRKGRRNVVLAGSNESLHNALRDIRRSRHGTGFNVVGLLATGSSESGRSIRGVPIIGTLSTLANAYMGLSKKYEDPPYIIAVDPNPDPRRANALVRAAAAIGAPLSRLNRGSGKGALTSFEVRDLIGRGPRALDTAPVQRLVGGRRVLITGAGGSIGSELVRQVMNLDPQYLALVDQSEYNLYQIDRQIADSHGRDETWRAYLADVCDYSRMAEVFADVRPDVVLHAAALKHVPLGEDNPLETLRTNVEGTRNVLDLCVAQGTESFTLVSTDKAVNASNVMGASKCVAERLTLAYNRNHEDLLASAVRFGNVLASAGSVIPLFEEQIERGGPVTVTHPDATRYFMTTEEASALVLQAAALNASQKKAEASIYVLEMGEPVNIARLARQLISLRGKVPNRDIKIVYSGLRSGETLQERIVGTPENLESTYVDGILMISNPALDAAPTEVLRDINALLSAVQRRDHDAVHTQLAQIVATQDTAAPASNVIPLQLSAGKSRPDV